MLNGAISFYNQHVISVMCFQQFHSKADGVIISRLKNTVFRIVLFNAKFKPVQEKMFSPYPWEQFILRSQFLGLWEHWELQVTCEQMISLLSDWTDNASEAPISGSSQHSGLIFFWLSVCCSMVQQYGYAPLSIATISAVFSTEIKVINSSLIVLL